jgi:hypothetical protein
MLQKLLGEFLRRHESGVQILRELTGSLPQASRDGLRQAGLGVPQGRGMHGAIFQKSRARVALCGKVPAQGPPHADGEGNCAWMGRPSAAISVHVFLAAAFILYPCVFFVF